MKILYTINNYILGAKLRSCPTECIVRQEGIDKGHTEVVFDFADGKKGENQREFCDKILARKGMVV